MAKNKKETKAQMLRRLKRQRKKAGIGEFSKKKRRKTSQSRRKRAAPSRRATNRTIRRRKSTMAKKKTRRRKSGLLNKARIRDLTGSVGYAVVGEPVLDMLASKLGLNTADEFVKGIAGFIIGGTTTGVVKSIGDAAVVISTYKIAQQQLPKLSGVFNGQTASTSSNGVIVVG